MLNSLVSDHIEDFSSTRIKDINDTTRDAIRAQLREGVEAGEGYLELAARIKGVFTDCDQRRAETIARTEAMRSSNFAEHEAQAMSGVVEAREWIATPDDRAREDHLAINGQVRKLDEPFEFPDGTPVMFPGDSGDPAQDINCRCTTAAHFDEKDLAQDKRLAKWKAFDAKLGSWERAAKAAFRRGFEAQRDDVLDALRDAAGV